MAEVKLEVEVKIEFSRIFSEFLQKHCENENILSRLMFGMSVCQQVTFRYQQK